MMKVEFIGDNNLTEYQKQLKLNQCFSDLECLIIKEQIK